MSSSSLPMLLKKAKTKGDAKSLVNALKKMESAKVTVGTLVQGDLAKNVNKLRKHENTKVSSLAKSVTSKWKAIFAASKGKGSKRPLDDSKPSASAFKKFKLEALPISDDEVKHPKLHAWLSEKSGKSQYKLEKEMNPSRARIVDEKTYIRERPEQLDIGAKALIKRIPLTHPKSPLNLKAKGPVVYWMSRDQRVEDNWALIFAQQQAEANGVPIVVTFNLVPTFLEATRRQYGFMLRGLIELQENLHEKNIPFKILFGDPTDTIPQFIKDYDVSCLVTDFSPMRIAYLWKSKVYEKIRSEVPFVEVDAHNIVPVWKASYKLEYGARTIRKKLTQTYMKEYLTTFPKVNKQDPSLLPKTLQCDNLEKVSFKDFVENKKIAIDHSVPEISFSLPGEAHAQAHMENFLTKRLKIYGDQRNNPTKPEALSGISPYLHFGQISPQRVILEAAAFKSQCSSNSSKSLDSFIEECFVRRELAENYCFYNENYDNLSGCWNWAKTTLNIHRSDKRDKIYTKEQLEAGKTHDRLWNAAQHELVYTGKMHGYLRMYWAKQILLWCSTPEESLNTAIFLNDKYSIDGRDPNGYVGCMWSIAGVHDQGFAERNVSGKIRPMTYGGCKRKFNIEGYISMVSQKAREVKRKHASKK